MALKELLVEELTGEANQNEQEQNSAMLNMPDSIEQMMETLLANPQYTQIFLNRLQNKSAV